MRSLRETGPRMTGLTPRFAIAMGDNSVRLTLNGGAVKGAYIEKYRIDARRVRVRVVREGVCPKCGRELWRSRKGAWRYHASYSRASDSRNKQRWIQPYLQFLRLRKIRSAVYST